MLAFLVMFPGRTTHSVQCSRHRVLKFFFLKNNISGSSQVQATDANATGCVYT